jgi:hemerythrin
MRRIRWKPKYTTGIAEVDERNQALVELLNHFAGALGEVEHCQDITDL